MALATEDAAVGFRLRELADEASTLIHDSRRPCKTAALARIAAMRVENILT
jgi:hypothetical protein